ncbi:hypothetical protein AAY473_028302 [Plecturocebus cupreus]
MRLRRAGRNPPDGGRRNTSVQFRNTSAINYRGLFRMSHLWRASCILTVEPFQFVWQLRQTESHSVAQAGVQWHGTISAHYNLCLPGSNDFPSSVSQVAGTTGSPALFSPRVEVGPRTRSVRSGCGRALGSACRRGSELRSPAASGPWRPALSVRALEGVESFLSVGAVLTWTVLLLVSPGVTSDVISSLVLQKHLVERPWWKLQSSSG